MPHNVEEQTTVRDAIGHAVRLLQKDDPSDYDLLKAATWSDIAYARATSDMASSIADVADVARTIAIELGAISIAIGESGEAK